MPQRLPCGCCKICRRRGLRLPRLLRQPKRLRPTFAGKVMLYQTGAPRRWKPKHVLSRNLGSHLGSCHAASSELLLLLPAMSTRSSCIFLTWMLHLVRYCCRKLSHMLHMLSQSSQPPRGWRSLRRSSGLSCYDACDCRFLRLSLPAAPQACTCQGRRHLAGKRARTRRQSRLRPRWKRAMSGGSLPVTFEMRVFPALSCMRAWLHTGGGPTADPPIVECGWTWGSLSRMPWLPNERGRGPGASAACWSVCVGLSYPVAQAGMSGAQAGSWFAGSPRGCWALHPFAHQSSPPPVNGQTTTPGLHHSADKGGLRVDVDFVETDVLTTAGHNQPGFRAAPVPHHAHCPGPTARAYSTRRGSRATALR